MASVLFLTGLVVSDIPDFCSLIVIQPTKGELEILVVFTSKTGGYDTLQMKWLKLLALLLVVQLG